MVSVLLSLLFFALQSGKAETADTPVSGKWCYFCSDSLPTSTECRNADHFLQQQHDFRQMTEVDRLVHKGYLLYSCRPTEGPFCYTMEIYDADNNTQKTRYDRGCSNGRDFKLTFQNGDLFSLDPNDARIIDLQPTPTNPNRSTCLFEEENQLQVCLSLCLGNFCNGPKYCGIKDAPKCQWQLDPGESSGGGAGLKMNGCDLMFMWVLVAALRMLGL